MKFLTPILFAAGLALAAATDALPNKAELCEGDGKTALCGYRQPEDILRVPGTNWVLASGTSSAGGLHLIDARDKSGLKLFPSPQAATRWDKALYADCPGPPAADDEFAIAGIAVRPGRKATVYAIHLRKRFAVEVLEFDTAARVPVATWVGCVPTPEGLGLNSVAPLPDGGLVATKMLDRSADMEAAFNRIRDGEMSGEVWRWAPRAGWSKVPGSETSGANGIVASADGKAIYVAGWGNKTFFRLSLGGERPERKQISLPYRIDNIHWAADGAILGIGQIESPAGAATRVVKIDPRTLAVRDLAEQRDTPFFGQGSAAAEVGDEYWVGSPRRDRIAIFPGR